MLKHSRPGKHLKPVILKHYLADTRTCPVKVLHTYLKAKKEIRKCKTKLLITLFKPQSSVTVKTKSKWIKTSSKEAGIDANSSYHSS